MKKSKLLLHFLLTICSIRAFAQTPFTTIDSIDINNINASVLVHGDMWTNAAHTGPKCEFPNGKGANAFSFAGIWLAAFDAGNNLHIAAATQRERGIDYWPGPLSTGIDSINYTASAYWARIWKINRGTIDSFRTMTTHTLANTSPSILDWPAKGNMYAKSAIGTSLVISTDMAPFIDVDHDDIYNPLKGDYPDIKGDQALWYVINDHGPTHSETKGQPLGVEIQVMAYAFKSSGAANNIIYYQYTIINRSANNYSNFRFGLNNVSRLGQPYDAYLGCDSSRRMEIAYSATNEDGTGATGTYGFHVPMMGIRFVHQPGDVECDNLTALGSCMYYNNDFSVQGNPSSDTDYFRYLNATWRDGTHLKNDFKGAGINSTGYGSGPNTNYVFSGYVMDTTQWSECASQTLPLSMTYMVVSNNFSLPIGASQSLTLALIIADNTGGCPTATYQAIDSMADSAQALYCLIPPTGTPILFSAVSMRIYPNPAHDILTIDAGNLAAPATASVYNMLGQNMNVRYSISSNKLNLDISQLPPAVYTVQYGLQHTASLFVKQ